MMMMMMMISSFILWILTTDKDLTVGNRQTSRLVRTPMTTKWSDTLISGHESQKGLDAKTD